MSTAELSGVEWEIVDPSAKPRKWEKGEPIGSFQALDEAIAKKWMLWQGDRPVHAAWIGNQPYGYLKHALNRGLISRAYVTIEYNQWLQRELRESEPLLAF